MGQQQQQQELDLKANFSKLTKVGQSFLSSLSRGTSYLSDLSYISSNNNKSNNNINNSDGNGNNNSNKSLTQKEIDEKACKHLFLTAYKTNTCQEEEIKTGTEIVTERETERALETEKEKEKGRRGEEKLIEKRKKGIRGKGKTDLTMEEILSFINLDKNTNTNINNTDNNKNYYYYNINN